MKFLLTVVCFLVFAFLAEGKRYKRDLSERSLPEALHMVTNIDVADLQCLFDTTANCWKRGYINDLVDHLTEISMVLQKMKSFNWFTGTIPDFEEYEEELGNDVEEIYELLPEISIDKLEDDPENTYHRVFEPCVEEYLKIDFNDDSLANFEEARQKAINHFLLCEVDGFDKAKKDLGSICLSDAKDAIKEMNLILELMDDIRSLTVPIVGIMFLDPSKYSVTASADWNKALIEDAGETSHINAAFEALDLKYGTEEPTNPDASTNQITGGGAGRRSMLQKLVSQLGDVQKTPSAVMRNIRKKADFSSEKTKLKQRLEQLLSKNSRRHF